MKKILALIIVFVMVLSFSVCVSAEDVNAVISSEKVTFLHMLDVIDEYKLNTEVTVTRAAFTHMLIKAMNQEEATPSADLFADVTVNTPYAGSVARAYSLGLVNGGESGLFKPEDPITMEAALKMTVLALGYNDIAAAYGGYPVGYLRVAKEIDLINGVNISESYERADIYQLLFNFLMSDVCMVTSVVEDTLTFKRDIGNTPLNLYFNLEKDEGVVRTAGYTSMVHGYEAEGARVYVNGTNYTTNIENIENYIGLNASIWYNSKKEVKAIYAGEDNASIDIKSESIDSIEGNVIITYDEASGKNSKIVLDPSYTFVKNGRSINPEVSDFVAENSDLNFIDNNLDNKYDVVLSYVPEYIVVSYIDAVEGIVFDTNGSGKHLILNEEANIAYTLTRVDEDGVCVPMYMEDLTKNDVIKYYISEDGTYVRGEVCAKTLSGTVTERTENSVIIDGTEYKVNSYFGDATKLAFNVEYTLFLASDDTITCISPNQTGTMQYGFLIDFVSRKAGLDSLVMVRILATNNDIIEAELADQITLDGKKRVDKSSDEIINKLTDPADRNVTAYQVIRYTMDEENKVSKIDTAEELSDDEYSLDKLTDSNLSDDSLTRHLFKKTVFYHGTYKVFAPNAVVGASTVFISVPEEFGTLNNGSVRKFDEDDFNIITSADLQSYETMEVTMYDINKNLEPAIVLMYKGISGDNATVSNHATPAVVKGVTYGFTEDGDTTAIISFYQGKRAYKLPISTEKYATLGQSDLPAPGDIIRMVTDKHGEIANFKIDLKYNPAKDGKEASLSTTSQTLNSGLGNDVIYFGKSYFHSSSSLSMLVQGGKANGHDYLADIAAFKLLSNCSVIVYDATTATAKPGNLGMLADALSVGEENASLIAVKCYSHQISNIFIYK